MDYVALDSADRKSEIRTDGLQRARQVTVESEEADRRLDNFLLGRLKGIPRAHVYRMIRSGQVRVNSRRADPDTRLAAGDRVRIPPVRMSAAGAVKPRADRVQWIEKRIIHEDRDLLVLDKPAGLAVHGGSGVSLGAIELLRAARPDTPALGLVHRLDRETSGCLLIAKRHSTLRRLQASFRAGTVDKTYQALLLGRMSAAERLVDAPLLTGERQGGERQVRVDPAGKPAQTRFVVERRFALATLARVELLTGRTHQIRVHAAHIGHALAGDRRYGAEDDPVVVRFGLTRLFLHASGIAIEQPAGVALRVASPLPEELAAVLARLAGEGRGARRSGR
jgi:23S rRNA pseudouridine955/2504/2580 synthase